ncbi:TetR/AcrR family transcriptional regulator [Actinoplanes derwentensis]|uniref:DNA-binding transcriptional regulator, AcrR family n=1 Tax=Actinoplanes derwentensis TaxID=113562 RepID=A0A1H1TE37_9ACTN|nr:TetR/AcrR family transcriptional regulator [Actinoplanes derwentensis]GID89495.1 hypothetical protein Ade03nite_84190 [Actinoplanes derwentensis]SDS58216.1 DNA-binding transcriptional regulator, AcrR family [Actinoplanes derwentensis]
MTPRRDGEDRPVRLSAHERRHQVTGVAVTAFATGGYAGTSVDRVADLAGISTPYVTRMFGGKRRLFLAAFHDAADRIEAAPEFGGPGAATSPELSAMLLHGCAAAADPVIGHAVRERFGGFHAAARAMPGADAGTARRALAALVFAAVAGLLDEFAAGQETEILALRHQIMSGRERRRSAACSPTPAWPAPRCTTARPPPSNASAARSDRSQARGGEHYGRSNQQPPD